MFDMIHNSLSVMGNGTPVIGHINIGVFVFCIGNSQWCLYNTQSKFDLLFNTQSEVQQDDWMVLENNEKATLNINMPYWLTAGS